MRIVLLASGTAAVVAQPPTETPQKPAAPVPRPALVRESKPPARPREVAAAPPGAVGGAGSRRERDAGGVRPRAPARRSLPQRSPRSRDTRAIPSLRIPRLHVAAGSRGTCCSRCGSTPTAGPRRSTVQTSSGYAALDEAAVAAVKHWEFEPGRLAGEPVALAGGGSDPVPAGSRLTAGFFQSGPPGVVSKRRGPRCRPLLSRPPEPGPPLRRALLRRRHDDRHLLPPDLSVAAAARPQRALLRLRGRGAGRRASARACAAARRPLPAPPPGRGARRWCGARCG